MKYSFPKHFVAKEEPIMTIRQKTWNVVKYANVSGSLLTILLGVVQCEWASGCISCDIFTNVDFVYFSIGTSIAVSTSWSSLGTSAAPPSLETKEFITY